MARRRFRVQGLRAALLVVLLAATPAAADRPHSGAVIDVPSGSSAAFKVGASTPLVGDPGLATPTADKLPLAAPLNLDPLTQRQILSARPEDGGSGLLIAGPSSQAAYEGQPYYVDSYPTPDLDGDDHEDVLVSRWDRNRNADSTWVLEASKGADAGSLWTLRLPDSYEHYALLGRVDVNGDGVKELLVIEIDWKPVETTSTPVVDYQTTRPVVQTVSILDPGSASLIWTTSIEGVTRYRQQTTVPLVFEDFSDSYNDLLWYVGDVRRSLSYPGTDIAIQTANRSHEYGTRITELQPDECGYGHDDYSWTRKQTLRDGRTGGPLATIDVTSTAEPPSLVPVKDVSGDGIADVIEIMPIAGDHTALRARSLDGSIAYWRHELAASYVLRATPTPLTGADAGDLILTTSLITKRNCNWENEEEYAVHGVRGLDGADLWTLSDPSLSPIGDVDGDGGTDLIREQTDTPYSWSPDGDAATLSVISGSDGSTVWGPTRLEVTPLPGEDANAGGYRLADLDGDGVLDPLVYLWESSDSVRTVGVAGRDGEVLWRSFSTRWGFGTGWGDLDGDSKEDVGWSELLGIEGGYYKWRTHLANGLSLTDIAVYEPSPDFDGYFLSAANLIGDAVNEVVLFRYVGEGTTSVSWFQEARSASGTLWSRTGS